MDLLVRSPTPTPTEACAFVCHTVVLALAQWTFLVLTFLSDLQRFKTCNEMLSPKGGSCAGWAGWGKGDWAQVWTACTWPQPPALERGLWSTLCSKHCPLLKGIHFKFFVKMAHEKKATCECCGFICKRGGSWKSCSVALPFLMSMCPIYGTCTISYLSIDLIFLGIEQWFSLGIMLDSADLAWGPTSVELSAP